MNYEKNLFKTKFGRRILIIFIACTILPLLALSVFVYHQITSDLRAQTLLRLKQITKSISMSVFERLLFLEAEMQLIGSQFARSMPADSYQSLLNANKAEFNQFKAMAIYDDQGNRVTLFGDTGKFPEYALLDKRVSETNKTTILTATENASIPTIFLAAPIIRTEHASRFMVGEASIENLDKILVENVISAMTGFLILDAAGNVLISPEKSDES